MTDPRAVLHTYLPTAGGDELGGHAVKIIGWGTEDSQPYWVSAMRIPARGAAMHRSRLVTVGCFAAACGQLVWCDLGRQGVFQDN